MPKDWKESHYFRKDERDHGGYGKIECYCGEENRKDALCNAKLVLWKVPYRGYYMSCNLDHVLYDKRNSTDEEKEQDAYAFAKTYKDNVTGFLSFM